MNTCDACQQITLDPRYRGACVYCPSCDAELTANPYGPAPTAEQARLFTPAPEQLPGQTRMEDR